jgi:hypothetical protein
MSIQIRWFATVICLPAIIPMLSFTISFAQTKISWDILSDVTFEEKYVTEADDYFLFPTFGNKVQAYDGQRVEITGYVIPIDPEGMFYILSKFPYASCFFCGQAGPETIVELQLTGEKKRHYELDEIITFKGILKLNATDVDHCNYILESATE